MKKTYIHPTFEVIVLEQMCKQLLPTSNIRVVDDEEYVVNGVRYYSKQSAMRVIRENEARERRYWDWVLWG